MVLSPHHPTNQGPVRRGPCRWRHRSADQRLEVRRLVPQAAHRHRRGPAAPVASGTWVIRDRGPPHVSGGVVEWRADGERPRRVRECGSMHQPGRSGRLGPGGRRCGRLRIDAASSTRMRTSMPTASPTMSSSSWARRSWPASSACSSPAGTWRAPSGRSSSPNAGRGSTRASASTRMTPRRSMMPGGHGSNAGRPTSA